MGFGAFLSGAAGGFTTGFNAGMVGVKLGQQKNEQEQKEAQADARVKRAINEGAWDRGMKIWEDPNMPAPVKVATYNRTMRAAMANLGHEFPELPADFEIGADDVKLMKGLTAIVRDPNTSYDEKLDNIGVMTAHLSTNPKYAPLIKSVLDRSAAERQAEVDTVANVYGRILAQDPTLTEEETGLFYAQRAIAQAYGRDDDPQTARMRRDRGLIVAEGMQKAHAQRTAQAEARTKGFLKVGATDRAFQVDEAGVPREVIGASTAEVPPARAAAQTFAQLLGANPGMSEEAAAIQAWRQHGDLPESMKSLVPPLAKAEIENERKKQQALQPGRVEVARQTGAVAAGVKEAARLNKPVSNVVKRLAGIAEDRRITIGEAEAMGLTPEPDPVVLREAQQARTFTERFITDARAAQKHVRDNPAAFGTSGALASTIAGMQAQARSIASTLGYADKLSTDPKKFGDTFREMGIENARTQSMIFGLAYSAAAASGQTGRAISDRDIEFFLKRIGANVNDPAAFVGVLDDLQGQVDANHRVLVGTAIGREPASLLQTSKGSDRAGTVEQWERAPDGTLRRAR